MTDYDEYSHDFSPEEIATDDILKYFTYSHLGWGPLAQMSALFTDLALKIVRTAPRCPERTVALRKLLEGKDAAVRAML